MIKKKFLIFELIIVAFITSCASSNVITKTNLAENTIIEDKHDEDVEEDNKLTRSDYEKYYKFDTNSSKGNDKDGARYLTKGKYHFSKTSKKYNIDPSFVPSEVGLDTLNISGK